MSTDPISEILSAQADQLNRGEPFSESVSEQAAPDQRANLVPLMQTAARAKHALVPVTMPPTFRARLREGLMMAAQHKESQRILLGRHEPNWGWVIGAAALGSAAGLIAMAWRARHSRHGVTTSRLAPKSDNIPVGQES